MGRNVGPDCGRRARRSALPCLRLVCGNRRSTEGLRRSVQTIPSPDDTLACQPYRGALGYRCYAECDKWKIERPKVKCQHQRENVFRNTQGAQQNRLSRAWETYHSPLLISPRLGPPDDSWEFPAAAEAKLEGSGEGMASARRTRTLSLAF